MESSAMESSEMTTGVNPPQNSRTFSGRRITLMAGVAGLGAAVLFSAPNVVPKLNFSPAIAKRLRDQCREAFTTGFAPRKSGELTTREAEVLQLIAEGFSNKQIAAELNISIKTVEKHRQQVMNKLNIHDVAGLTRYAISKGMVERTVPAAV